MNIDGINIIATTIGYRYFILLFEIVTIIIDSISVINSNINTKPIISVGPAVNGNK